jgi:hypothetical protein
MDETEYLEEGQVYCPTTDENGHLAIAEGLVVITRCPALHPGDVQCALAVKPPDGSPLKALRNCIVFSSKGDRDLPSKLSGGDLDGDLFHVIKDKRLFPKSVSLPADYPATEPIDIGREVTREDMTEFFVTFMEKDVLAHIATLHQITADQNSRGTFDPACLHLANLHSTAVDFSKTGKPVCLPPSLASKAVR